jgi:XTP/dITP diphosphohydrolase
VDGDIVWPPRGSEGHGYDPVFQPKGETRTFGEMSMAEKAQYSHRANAFAAFVKNHLARD